LPAPIALDPDIGDQEDADADLARKRRILTDSRVDEGNIVRPSAKSSRSSTVPARIWER
jgi:hypothetical protein